MSEEGITRRNFMIRTMVSIFAFIGAALAVPLGGFSIFPALKRRESGWSDAGTARDLRVNVPQERRFYEVVKKGWREEKVERAAWFVKQETGIIVVFSPSCPHLGCGYRWLAATQRFECPCHASVFDINGKVLSGPAPRALDVMESRLDSGRVLVKFEIFQLGTPKKVLAWRRRHAETGA
jgi:menaquinol-cytochrome c reductase iron-sulfur subunit